MSGHHMPHIITSGLVMHLDAANTKSYPGSGVMWADLSGEQNNGELKNSPTFNNINGGAILFNGGTQYIDCGNDKDSLILSSGGTIEAFVRFDDFGSSWYNTIMGKGGSGWLSHHYILFEGDGTNQLWLSVSNGISSLSTGGPRTRTLSLDTWYHVVATWDFNKKKMFLDGNLEQSVDSTIMPINSAAQVSIGKTGTSGYYFNGNMSYVRTYNRALTEIEIIQNYNAVKSRFGL